MIDLNKYFDLWKRVLTKPEQTFKAEIKKSSPEGFTKNLAVAGLITGFIAGIVAALGLSGTLFGALGGITAFVLVLVAMIYTHAISGSSFLWMVFFLQTQRLYMLCVRQELEPYYNV